MILIIGIGTITANSAQVRKSNELTELGNKYLLETNYDQAVIEFTDALAINKKNVDARVGLADAYNGLKKYDKSVGVLNDGIQILPNEAKFYIKLAETYLLKGETENALKELSDGYEKTKDPKIKEKLDEITKNIDLVIEKSPIQKEYETKVFVVEKDSSGNVIKNLKAKFVNEDSKIGEVSNISETEGSYKGNLIGKDTVIATVGGYKFSEDIEVKDKVLAKIEVVYSETNKVGDAVEFKVVGKDQSGKEMEVVPEWDFDSTMADLISTDGQLLKVKYVKDGSFNLVAKAEDLEEKVTVSVLKRKFTVSTMVSGNGEIEKSNQLKEIEENSKLTLTAKPKDGWHFVSWSGDVSGKDNPIQITINSNKNIKAIFEINKYVLTTSVDGEGEIARTPATDTYSHGQKVQVKAIPRTGYKFVRWEGDITGTNEIAVITMDKAKNIKAIFEESKAVKVSGKIVNAKNNEIIKDSNIKIREGYDNVSGNPVITTKSNDKGEYVAQLNPGKYTFEILKDGFTTNTINVDVIEECQKQFALNPIEENVYYNYRIVLTWDSSPSDLDSYLIYRNDGKYINYSQRIAMDGEKKIAELDTDKTSGFGPETITLYEVNNQTNYKYFVKNFSGGDNLYLSKAKVQVYSEEKLINTFEINNNESGKGKLQWNVFNIENGKIVPINTLN